MDQVKDILRQIARYRFWISVCLAALLSAGAYVLGSGPVQKQTADETGKITSAYKDVQQYSSNSPTAEFAPIVEEKTAVLTKDVDAAWKQLYDRQAPLLTWPETVSERFKAWGRKWPEDAAPSAVQIAIFDYVEAYPAYVDQVFKTFRPFDYETGEGIVASPPKEQLLHPVAFDTNKKTPGLGEVWSAQERLWVQRTALEVINQVNRNAKDWDSAYIKEIKLLEVGSELAQDQRSLAKGEVLEEAEAIRAPNEPEEEEEGMGSMGEMGGMMGSGMMSSAMMGRMGGMGGSGMGGAMGGMAGGAVAEAQSVLFLKPENATQYKILPIMFTVLIDQDHIPDLLVELENSPMSIEVRDFEMLRPSDKVVKPEKGEQFMGGYGMMGMMGPGMMGRRGMMGYGGMSSAMMRGMGRMGEMDPGMMGMGAGMMGPGMMGSGMTANARKGVDKRGENRAERRKEQEKALEASKAPVNFDAYFNIVEVTVYGQARFYDEPTPPEEGEGESPGATEADAAATGAESGDAMPAEPTQAAPAEQPEAAPAEATAPAEQPEAAPAGAEAGTPAEPAADPAAPAGPEAPKAEAPADGPAEGAEPAPQP